MAYIVESLSKITLQKLFFILEGIKLKSEIRNRRKFLLIAIEESDNITIGDHRSVISNLINDSYIKESFWSYLVPFWWDAYVININDSFFEFYDRVKLQLAKFDNPEIPQKLTSHKFEFDIEDGTLSFMGHDISMTIRGPKTNAHRILEHIFTAEDGLAKKYPYWIIAEDTFKEEFNKWKKYHHACEDANLKIFKKTGIIDFLNFTTGDSGWVAINEKYLK